MTPVERVGFLAHARGRLFAKRLEEAQQIIGDGLSQCQQPYVACSFGKDSAAMLHLIMRHRPDIQVRFVCWPETLLLNNFDEILGQWKTRFGIEPMICNLTRESIEEIVPQRHRAVEQMAAADGYFIGLRAGESRGRRLTLKAHGTLYEMNSGLLRIAPLAWWGEQDVAAYTALHDLPILASYGSTGMEGRTATRVGLQSHNIRRMQLDELRQRDPVAFSRLCEALPEVREWLAY